MAKNKYDFIKELIEEKKLNLNQRERILELASREISLDETLENRVQKIEEIIFKESNPRKKNSKENIPILENLIEYNDPIKLYNALLAFNQNPILKTTCHPISRANIDSIIEMGNMDDYNFNKHLELIKINFIELSKSQRLTKNMYKLIRNYLFGEDSWSSQNIQYHWSNKDLEAWASKNVGLVPNPEESIIESTGNEGFQLERPFVSKLTNQTIENLNDLVLCFKSLWHIKDDNPLQKILEKRNTDYKYEQWADFRFVNFSPTLNIFTDVDKLIQAYSAIIQLIKEKCSSNRQDILVSFYEEGTKKILSIHQLNTFWKKSLSDTIERPFGNSMTPLIDKLINGLCDLHIQAKFENNKSYKVNLWDGKKRKEQLIPMIEGVQYLLILKK